MLAQISLALLLGNPIQSQDPTIPAQIKEAFGKVVSTASDLKKEIPALGFHPGACLLGGNLKQGGSFSYSTNIKDEADYAVLVGTYGNDSDVEITVKDPSGKNIATEYEGGGAEFSAEAAGKYIIAAKNKGGETMVALAIVRTEGGAVHPFSAINTAVASIATGVKDAFQDGYSIPTNTLMIMGAIVEPNASYSRTGNFNYPRWMIMSGADAGSKSFALSVTDTSTKETTAATEDAKYAYCDFETAIANASVTMKNTGSRRILAIHALLR